MQKTRNARLRIRAKMEQLSPEMVFQTPSYLHLLRSIARELTGGKRIEVHLYGKPEDKRLGWCDWGSVWINLQNAITSSFPTLALKNESFIGILGHECGHKQYSDFGLKQTYLEGFSKGIWYPFPPEPETDEERKALEEILTCLKERDANAIGLIVQVTSYLNNLLEDVYVEERMCQRFPGSVKRGIRLNRIRNLEGIPTLWELREEKEDNLSIFMNLCSQYALSGRINNWEEETCELLDALRSVAPIIQRASRETAPSARFLAANEILLKSWRYLSEILREVETPPEEERGQKEDASKKPECGEKADTPKEAKGGENPKAAGATETAQGQNGTSLGEQEGSAGDGRTSKEQSRAMKAYLAHLKERLPAFLSREKEPGIFRGFPTDVTWSGTNDKESTEAAKQQEGAKEAGAKEDLSIPGQPGQNAEEETAKAEAPQKALDADGLFSQLLWQMAKEEVESEIDREILRDLQLVMDQTDFDAGHQKVKKLVQRQDQFDERTIRACAQYEERLKPIWKRLKAALLPILKNQKTRTEHRLFMGRRLDMRNIADPNGALFQKENPGKKVELAVVVLLDLSESMTGDRIEQSKLAALCLYAFCRQAGIPIAIYGHHTDGFWHKRLEDETVFLHCCAEFEPDRNDQYRIVGLRPCGANRDGVALRFLGQRLLGRPEKQKLLVLISDGFPNSNQYRGKRAGEDLRAIKKELTAGGVLFVAAAIGSDKDKIREIYRDSFLDISDLEKMPALLVKQVLKYIRR